MFFRDYVNDGFTEVRSVAGSPSGSNTFESKTLSSSCANGGSAVMLTVSGSNVGEGAFRASVTYTGPCKAGSGAGTYEQTGNAWWIGTGNSAGYYGGGTYSATLSTIWPDSRTAHLSGTCTSSGTWSFTSSTESVSGTITCNGHSFACSLASDTCTAL